MGRAVDFLDRVVKALQDYAGVIGPGGAPSAPPAAAPAEPGASPAAPPAAEGGAA
jgi:hypothetical protein